MGFSLPLMGIENDAARATAVTRDDGSLPLMGIENREHRHRRPGAPAAHYPSWGSKTLRIPRSRPTRETAHYPSWGSKTTSTSPIRIAPSGSLPLMGIENAVAGAGVDTVYPLITPHGDRKQADAGHLQVRELLTSLPLMGIENTRRRPMAPRTTRSHYPSWGSKTSNCAPKSRRTGSSLPLMGIENARLPRAARSRSMVSLPLMGIENGAVAVAGADARLELITPHGDRKPDF